MCRACSSSDPSSMMYLQELIYLKRAKDSGSNKLIPVVSFISSARRNFEPLHDCKVLFSYATSV